MIIVAPSLLACDYTCMKTEIERVSAAPWLHYDVMDGVFVPNISMGTDILKSVRAVTQKVIDVHLMIAAPEKYVEEFALSGADILTFHIESEQDCGALIKQIRSLGKRVGISINPQTPAKEVFPFLDDIDIVLVMSVEPGFGGQSFIEPTLEKIAEIRREADRRGLRLDIEVDGGINLETGAKCVAYGANVLVAGSAIFKSDNPSELIARLESLG